MEIKQGLFSVDADKKKIRILEEIGVQDFFDDIAHLFSTTDYMDDEYPIEVKKLRHKSIIYPINGWEILDTHLFIDQIKCTTVTFQRGWDI